MNKNEIYEAIDNLKAGRPVDLLILERFCNYIEANIDEFVETYSETDNETDR